MRLPLTQSGGGGVQMRVSSLLLRETFSFVLTNVDGSRKIGYCRRLLVCAAQNCPLLSAAAAPQRAGSGLRGPGWALAGRL